MRKTLFFVCLCLIFAISLFGQSVNENEKKLVLDKIDVSESYMVNKRTGNQIKVIIETDSSGVPRNQPSPEFDVFFKSSIGDGFYCKYKTKSFRTGSTEMYDAIKDNNPLVVKDLLSLGYDVTIPIFISDFSDFTTSGGLMAKVFSNGGTIEMGSFWARRDKEGYILCSALPTPAKKIFPLEFAQEKGNDEIISLISSEFQKQLLANRDRAIQDSLASIRILARKDSLINAGYKLIIPGKGFDTIAVGKTTSQEVIQILGSDFERIDQDKDVTQISYKQLGVSFYFYYHKNLNKLGQPFWIVFKRPFKGVTSNGIDLNSSTVADVIRMHGDDNKSNEPENDIGRIEYAGITFYYNNETQNDSNHPSQKSLVFIMIE